MPKVKSHIQHAAADQHHQGAHHHNHIAMDGVKIKRVKRDKKKITTKEKIVAGLGVGSTLMGGLGGAVNKPAAQTTQFVRTQTNQKSGAGSKIKAAISKFFGQTVKADSISDDMANQQQIMANAQAIINDPSTSSYDLNQAEIAYENASVQYQADVTQQNSQSQGGSGGGGGSDSGGGSVTTPVNNPNNYAYAGTDANGNPLYYYPGTPNTGYLDPVTGALTSTPPGGGSTGSGGGSGSTGGTGGGGSGTSSVLYTITNNPDGTVTYTSTATGAVIATYHLNSDGTATNTGSGQTGTIDSSGYLTNIISGYTPPAPTETAAPTITLYADPTGGSIAAGTSYSDPGASAIDSLGNALTVTSNASQVIDTSGDESSFTITYSATDQSGNTTTATRTVTVTLATKSKAISAAAQSVISNPGGAGTNPALANLSSTDITSVASALSGAAIPGSFDATSYWAWALSLGGQTTFSTSQGQTYYLSGSTWSTTPPGGGTTTTWDPGQTDSGDDLNQHFAVSSYVSGVTYQINGTTWTPVAGSVADGSTLNKAFGGLSYQNGTAYTYTNGTWTAETRQVDQDGNVSATGKYTQTFYGGQWVYNNGQTKVENGYNWTTQGGVWVQGAAVKAPDTFVTVNGLTIDTSLLAPGTTEGQTLGYAAGTVLVWHNGAWGAPSASDLGAKFIDGAGILYTLQNTAQGLQFVQVTGTIADIPSLNPATGKAWQENDSYALAANDIVVYHNGAWGAPNPGDHWQDAAGNIYVFDGNGWIIDSTPSGTTQPLNGQGETVNGTILIYHINPSIGIGQWGPPVAGDTYNGQYFDGTNWTATPKEGDTRVQNGVVQVFHNNLWGAPQAGDKYTDASGIQYTYGFLTNVEGIQLIPNAGQQAYYSPSTGKTFGLSTPISQLPSDAALYTANGRGGWVFAGTGATTPTAAKTATTAIPLSGAGVYYSPDAMSVGVASYLFNNASSLSWLTNSGGVYSGNVQAGYDASGNILYYTINGVQYTPQDLANAVVAIGQTLQSQISSTSPAAIAAAIAGLSPSDQQIYILGTSAFYLPGSTLLNIPGTGDNLTINSAGNLTYIFGNADLFQAPSQATTSVAGEPTQVIAGFNTGTYGIDSNDANAALAAVQSEYPGAQLFNIESGFGGTFQINYNGDPRADWLIVYTNSKGQQIEVDPIAVLTLIGSNNGQLPSGGVPAAFQTVASDPIPAAYLVSTATAPGTSSTTTPPAGGSGTKTTTIPGGSVGNVNTSVQLTNLSYPDTSNFYLGEQWQLTVTGPPGASVFDQGGVGNNDQSITGYGIIGTNGTLTLPVGTITSANYGMTTPGQIEKWTENWYVGGTLANGQLTGSTLAGTLGFNVINSARPAASGGTTGGGGGGGAGTTTPPAFVAPSIASLGVSHATAGSVVTISGSNFSNVQYDNAVLFIAANGATQQVSANLQGSNTLNFTVPNLPAGAYTIKVINVNNTQQPSNGLPFTIDSPAAGNTGSPLVTNPLTVTSVSPSSVAAGQFVNVTAVGTGFTNVATVAAPAGSGLTITNVQHSGDNTLTFTVSAAASATAGVKTLTVTGTTGGLTTIAFAVTAQQASSNAPVITGISSSSATAGQSFPIIINGSNLSGATFSFPAAAGITVSNAVVSSNQITATFTVAASATPGSYVFILNTANGSIGFPFTVNAAGFANSNLPVISTVSSSAITAGQSIPIVINGSNLSGATFSFPAAAGITISNVLVNSNQIEATLTAAASATPGSYTSTLATETGYTSFPFKVNAAVASNVVTLALSSNAAGWNQSTNTLALTVGEVEQVSASVLDNGLPDNNVTFTTTSTNIAWHIDPGVITITGLSLTTPGAPALITVHPTDLPSSNTSQDKIIRINVGAATNNLTPPANTGGGPATVTTSPSPSSTPLLNINQLTGTGGNNGLLNISQIPNGAASTTPANNQTSPASTGGLLGIGDFTGNGTTGDLLNISQFSTGASPTTTATGTSANNLLNINQLTGTGGNNGLLNISQIPNGAASTTPANNQTSPASTGGLLNLADFNGNGADTTSQQTATGSSNPVIEVASADTTGGLLNLNQLSGSNGAATTGSTTNQTAANSAAAATTATTAAATNTTDPDAQLIAGLNAQVVGLQAQLTQAQQANNSSISPAAAAQIVSLQSQINQLNAFIQSLQSRQVGVLGAATSQPVNGLLQMPAGSLLQMPTSGLQMSSLTNDISARYANVNGTIYDKTTGQGFATPQQFFSASGLNSFSGLIFDTNWQPAQSAAASSQTYTVKKGDTLWNIAKKYYGDGTQWRTIYTANLSKIPGGPKKLRIGTVLTIPSNS